MQINSGDCGVDFSYARPDPALMAQRGVTFICRYLTSSPKLTAKLVQVVRKITPFVSSAPKHCNLAELQTYWAQGIATPMNFEESSTLLLSKDRVYVASRGQAAIVAAQANTMPAGECIVVSHDTGSWNENVVPNMLILRDAFAAVGYTIGCYGSKDCVEACKAAGIVFAIVWAPGALSWGHGRHPDSHIWQGPISIDIAGMGSVDGNTAKRSFQAWLPGSQPHPEPLPPAPVPIAIEDEDDMNLVTITCSTDPSNRPQFIAGFGANGWRLASPSQNPTTIKNLRIGLGGADPATPPTTWGCPPCDVEAAEYDRIYKEACGPEFVTVEGQLAEWTPPTPPTYTMTATLIPS